MSNIFFPRAHVRKNHGAWILFIVHVPIVDLTFHSPYDVFGSGNPVVPRTLASGIADLKEGCIGSLSGRAKTVTSSRDTNRKALLLLLSTGPFGATNDFTLAHVGTRHRKS